MTDRRTGAHAHAVLVVDDDADNLSALVAYLDVTGFTVCGVQNATDALHQLRDGLRPCAMLVDVVMPDVDGWAFVNRLQSDPTLSTIPVVMYSGRVEDTHRAHRLGVRAYLTKPSDPQDIAAALVGQCPERAS